MDFSAIPLRGYSKTDPSWWNSLQAAGATLELEVDALSGNLLPPTQAILANNQVAAADVAAFLFDPATIGAFVATYRIYRNTTGAGATELAETGQLTAAYSPVSGTWALTIGPVVGNAGVTFSITNLGQVQYTSTNITGTAASSYIWFKAETLGI